MNDTLQASYLSAMSKISDENLARLPLQFQVYADDLTKLINSGDAPSLDISADVLNKILDAVKVAKEEEDKLSNKIQNLEFGILNFMPGRSKKIVGMQSELDRLKSSRSSIYSEALNEIGFLNTVIDLNEITQLAKIIHQHEKTMDSLGHTEHAEALALQSERMLSIISGIHHQLRQRFSCTVRDADFLYQLAEISI